MPDEPFYRNMEACYNCGAIFCTPVIVEDGEDEIFICPNSACGFPESQFFEVSDRDIWQEFNQVMGASFTFGERMFLRGVAEANMSKLDPKD